MVSTDKLVFNGDSDGIVGVMSEKRETRAGRPERTENERFE